jgi:hypothetical protein
MSFCKLWVNMVENKNFINFNVMEISHIEFQQYLSEIWDTWESRFIALRRVYYGSIWLKIEISPQHLIKVSHI